MALSLPEPDSTRLSSSPLELVTCQIRFESPTSPRDAKSALAFYESLGGKKGRYSKVDQVQSFNLAPGIGPTPDMTVGRRFASQDGKWIVSLMPDHVALETQAYEAWEEDFRDRLFGVIDAAEEHVQPAIEQRLGLRYIDRIKALGLSSAREWEPYLRPELLGLALHPELGDHLESAQQQGLFELDEELNCGLRHGFVQDQLDASQLDYLLDFDLYRQGVRPFDSDGVKAAAERLNRYGLQLFQAVVMPDLLERLR